MTTREKGPATGLESRTYTLLQSFSHELWVPAVNEEWISGIITALATPARTELPTQACIVQHRLIDSCYTLVARRANYHHITQYQP